VIADLFYRLLAFASLISLAYPRVILRTESPFTKTDDTDLHVSALVCTERFRAGRNDVLGDMIGCA